MKTLIALLFAFAVPAVSETNEMVYICTGSSAYAYHCNKNCRGLGRCGSDIVHMTKEKAISLGYKKPCGFCYKK